MPSFVTGPWVAGGGSLGDCSPQSHRRAAPPVWKGCPSRVSMFRLHAHHRQWRAPRAICAWNSVPQWSLALETPVNLRGSWWPQGACDRHRALTLRESSCARHEGSRVRTRVPQLQPQPLSSRSDPGSGLQPQAPNPLPSCELLFPGCSQGLDAAESLLGTRGHHGLSWRWQEAADWGPVF